jgi:NitT/TauT family transport system ATP-binding protein
MVPERSAVAVGSPTATARRSSGSTAPTIVEAVDISHTYEARRGARTDALVGVSFDVARGEFVSIVGPSGCGKSTLLMAVAGLITPTAGQIQVDGAAVTGPRRDVGVMFQTPELFPWRTVLDNVLLPVDVMRLDRKTHTERARQLLETVGLQGHERSYPRELSGGMQQRAALCRLLVANPTLVLMDEPFGALDEFTREKLNLELLRMWDEGGKTFLFVTHNIGEAVFLADRVIVMAAHPGRVIEDVRVDLPRPRGLSALQDPKYGEAVLRIRELLGIDR